MKKLIYLIPFFSLFNGLNFKIGGLNARVDQTYNILVATLFFLALLLKGKVKRTSVPGLWLIGLIIIAIISSAMNAPDKSYSIKQTINYFSAAAVFFLIPIGITSIDDLNIFIRILFKGTIVVSLIGIILFLFSFLTKIPIYGINIMQNETEPFGIYATMVEPNVYGGFMMIPFLISFCLNTSRQNTVIKVPGVLIKLTLIASAISVFLSFTRGVWLGIGICLGIYLIYSFKKSKMNIVKNVATFSLILAAIFVVINFLKIDFLQYKIDNFLSTESGTSAGRLQIYAMAYDNYITKGHFLLGNGSYSFASYFNFSSTNGYDAGSNAFIGSLAVSLLHDYGTLGIFFFLAFFISLLKLTNVKSRYLTDLSQQAIDTSILSFNLGLKLAVIGIVIASIFSNHTLLTFPWMLFGMIIAFNKIVTLRCHQISFANE